ncbi:MAG: RNA polymerase factor sigma-54 [Planctomycetota bacterium]
MQTQTQVMIPQIIQSVEILQLPPQNLQERIDQELAENPVLEVADTATELNNQGDDEVPDIASPPDEDIGNFEENDDFENVDAMAESYPEVFEEDSFTPSRGSSGYGDKDRKLDVMQNTPEQGESLQDHLYHQLALYDLTDHQRRLAENIIYNIDDNGYLQFSLEEIAQSIEDEEVDLEQMEGLLEMIQELEPPGVGARDLKECLMVQARVEFGDDSMEAHLIDKHLEQLEQKRFDMIAADMGLTVEQVECLVASITHLNPRPGSSFKQSEVPFVTPDVIVEKMDGRYDVRLADDDLPPLYISNAYRGLLRKRNSQSPATKKYLRQKIQSARWLIEAIEQRRETLLNVSNAIVEHQQEFLEDGPVAVKPLRMKTIAEQVGIHVATVCRAVANKYMETPHGVFELRYFFPSGYTTDSGEEVSDDAVRRAMAEVIENEDKTKPLSDEAIVKVLNDQGIPIARRTVTKYRKILGIPSSRKRRIK